MTTIHPCAGYRTPALVDRGHTCYPQVINRADDDRSAYHQGHTQRGSRPYAVWCGYTAAVYAEQSRMPEQRGWCVCV